MAFDRSKFDLSYFDRAPRDDNTRWIEASGAERITAQIGSSLNYFLFGVGYERVDKATLSSTPCYFLSVVFNEIIEEVVTNASMYALIKTSGEECISGSMIQSADIRLSGIANEVITWITILAADLKLSEMLEEQINQVVLQSAEIYLIAAGFELVYAQSSSEAIETKTCVLTLTLRPGERLVIDANNYNVLLDGENAIHTQSGDWIDGINRKTTSLEIASASGSNGIRASIMYTERFL